MRLGLLLIALLVLMAGSASAFPVQLEVVERRASSDDPAVFNLTVENDYANQERFRINSLNSPPVASTWFDYEYSKTIESGETGVFQVKVTPEENVIQQNYEFTLNIRSFNNDELEKASSFFTVFNRYNLEITSFQVSSQEVAPGDTLEVSATVRNTASETLEDFKVSASGFNGTVEKEGAVLGSGDSIRYNFELDVPERNSPGEESISVSISDSGEEARSLSQTVSVQEVREVDVNSYEEDRLLVRTRTIELQNHGNTKVSEEIREDLPVYIDPLASFEPAPDSTTTEGGTQNYLWNVELEPGEEKSVSYTVSYLPAIGFIALLFLGVLGFKKLQTDIEVSKKSFYRDGEIKVRIELENNSSNVFTDLTVKDFVPDIAEVSQEFEMAKPRVTKTSSGTRLQWDIDSLQPGEQRVLEYTLKPMVEVEGGVTLGAAEILRDGEKLKETSEAHTDFKPE